MTLTKGWTHPDAECRGADPDLFVPEAAADRRNDNFHIPDLAVAICARCPVRSECLDHAVTHRERGVWGGTNDAQRAAIRKRRNIAPPGQRQAIINTLWSGGEWSVDQLARRHGVTRSSAQQHLQRIQRDGLAHKRMHREGSRRVAMWRAAVDDEGVGA